MKKLYVLAGSALSSAFLFAEGEPQIDTSVVLDTLTRMQNDLGGFVTSALPVVAGIGCAFMAFWLGRMVFGLVKNWCNAGK